MARSTYTYAVLEVSQAAFDEIRALLKDAGYHGAFQKDDGAEVIDMHGIALKSAFQPPPSDDADVAAVAAARTMKPYDRSFE